MDLNKLKTEVSKLKEKGKEKLADAKEWISDPDNLEAITIGIYGGAAYLIGMFVQAKLDGSCIKQNNELYRMNERMLGDQSVKEVTVLLAKDTSGAINMFYAIPEDEVKDEAAE